METGPEMSFHFGQLLAQLARTRRVRAGAIISTGPVCNQDRAKGYACVADKRAAEIVDKGAAKTAYLAFGDSVRIELKGRDGLSLFGAIEQTVSDPA